MKKSYEVLQYYELASKELRSTDFFSDKKYGNLEWPTI
ncbi:MAG: hypothetical protein ACD_44C00049G0012 [uncultured bacterium]|nr:MAG: hypothetical protein ACD_44C00049G0012 [uncultured bacterium]